MWSEKRKKNIFPNLLFSKFFLIFCIVLFLFILFALAKSTIRTQKVDMETTDLQKEIKQLENQNQELGQLIDYLKSDTFIEQEAKLKLGLKNPDEYLVVIPKQELGPETKTEVNNQQLTNPSKWWLYFFGNIK